MGEEGNELRRKGASRDPKVFVLLRELSEVHLLLDNVSADPTTTVSELTDSGKLEEQGLTADWIEKVCQISWPPDGSNEEKAEDAALLIRVKDYLNRLSHPASGSTIAFTHLVTQEGSGKKARWKFWKREDETDAGAAPEPGRGGSKGRGGAATRRSLAETAYPDLIGKAASFRRAMWWISIGLVAALVLTCALSWHVAYGNAALAELATVRTTLADLQARIAEAEAGEAARRAEGAEGAEDGEAAGTETASGGAAPTAAADEGATRFTGYCERDPYVSATQLQLCTALSLARDSEMRLHQRLHQWRCWELFTDCSDVAKAVDAPSKAAAFANIMGSAVLPFLYGLLGAGAAIIRSLSRKIRASLLSPRDLHLSFQQLALGAVVGACIGLFVAAPGSDATGESLLGPVALSASAISFVAGFGVEAVFQALEALIARIFNVAPPATANRGDGLPSS